MRHSWFNLENWQEIFTASLFWTGFKSKKPKFYMSITFKQRIFY
jgi:hypothetical protein